MIKIKRIYEVASAEVGIQFGAGGASATEELEAEGVCDPQWAILQAKRFLEAGAYMIMIESEGITENVKRSYSILWRIGQKIRKMG